jgi:hypothetical protein
MKYFSQKMNPFFLLVGLAISVGSLKAVSIGSYRDFPVGSLKLSLREGKESVSLQVKWGGETEASGAEGPVVNYTSGRGENPVTSKIGKDALERLFGLVTKLGSGYAVPRSTTADRKNQDMIQIYIGLQSEPVWLSFPANEYSLWNKAAETWTGVSEILMREASISLPLAKPREKPADAPPLPNAGLSSIADYTALNISVQRVHLSETHYGTISVKWNRTSDGKIDFTLKYNGRGGDSAKAAPNPKQIQELFREIQSLVKSYRHPSFEGSKKITRTDHIILGLSVNGHPGECTFPSGVVLDSFGHCL